MTKDKEIIKEQLEKKYPKAMYHVKELLRLMGDNPDREGLSQTPFRVIKSWTELFSGYDQDPKEILGTVFQDNIGDVDEIILCKDISFTSFCEHHCLPFSGKCYIGYLPNKRVVGLSKLARLVDVFAKRLQIQEKMTSQIAQAIMDYLNPQGCGVIIKAKHLCMSSRGVKNHSAEMITSSMKAKFRTQPQTRSEFLSLINI